MIANLRDYIDIFSELRVLVIGEAMLDSYLVGTADRICREAPVPVVALSGRKDAPGGAANTAANAGSLGADVTFLSVTGDDHEALLLRRALEERGISTAHLLTQPGRQTLAKHRIVASSQILARFDQGSTGPVDPNTEHSIIARLTNLFPRADAVIVSDYGYGILTPRVIDALARLQARTPRVLVVDSKRLPAYRHAGPTAVKPNHDEAIKLLGAGIFSGPLSRHEAIAAESERLLDLTGAQLVAVTLDSDGAIIIERDTHPYRTFARPMPQARTVGAGDTFLGVMALALAAGAGPHIAAELASAAAHIVVARDGTVACTADELTRGFSACDKLVTDPAALAARAGAYREQGQRIVLTRGCFSLQRHDVAFLSKARALGDLLIVAVNPDRGLGPHPGDLAETMQALAALSCVDLVLPLAEDTPAHLIRSIRPDVFAIGGMAAGTPTETALVRETGGTVHVLPYETEAYPTPALGLAPGAEDARPAKPFLVVNNDQAYAG